MASSVGLMFVAVFLVSLVCQTRGQSFKRGPSSLTVYEGQNATFTCVSSYTTACSSQNYHFRWYRGESTLVADCDPTPKYDIGLTYWHSRSLGEYRLTIRNVQPADSGQYHCALIFQSPDSVTRSLPATLTVRRLPRNNPSCTSEPLQPTVGTRTTLTCGLSPYDSWSVLTWYRYSSLGYYKSLGFCEVQPGHICYTERVLTESDNMREFTCIAGPHPNGPSCAITPLQIPTTVSISPSQLTLHEHKNATFTCDFKSTPQQTAGRYEWRVFKDGIPEVEVNQNLEGRFELEKGGRTLQIIDVTLEELNNAQIRCVAFYDGTNYTSDNDSLLVVVPLTTALPDQSSTTTTTERKSDDGNTTFIIGGILGAVFLLLIIALLGCYMIKNKHNRTRPGQRAVTRNQKPSLEERVDATNRDESPPTYDQISLDTAGGQNRQYPVDFTTQTHVLYTCPNKTGPEIQRLAVPLSSATDGQTEYANIEDATHRETGQESDFAIYTMPEKAPTSRPIISDTEALGPQQKNVEGLAYADLDLQHPASATQAIMNHSGDQTTYTEICCDN